MYTKDSLIVDLVQALNETDVNTKTLSRKLKLRNGELSEVLRFAGFQYEGRKWAFKHNNKSNLDLTFKQLQAQLNDITSNTDNNDNKSNTDNTKHTESNISNNDNTVLPFTPIEIEALREVAQLHINKQPIAPADEPTDATTDILERVQSLEPSKTDRKTFVIEKELIEQFDAFCATHRLKKSDILSIAIRDLLEKYK